MLGVILVVISTLFSSGKDLLSKKISFVMHGTLSALLSFIMAIPWYLLIFVLAYLAGIDLYEYRGEFLFYIVLRSIIDALAELSKMHALACGEISFISNFFSLTPIFILFLAPLITGETISIYGVIGVIIIFIGTAMLFRGTKQPMPWRGILLGICASLCFAINTCLDRLAATHGNPIFSGFLMTVFAAILLIGPAWRVALPRKQIYLALLPLLWRGLFETLYMIFKLASLQYLEPQYAAGIGKLTLVISVVVGGSIFHESDRVKRIASALLIVIGSLIITFAKFAG